MAQQFEYNGSTAIDEECRCSHRMTAHLPGRAAQGHGPCSECACSQFTWRRFIFAPEVTR